MPVCTTNSSSPPTQRRVDPGPSAKWRPSAFQHSLFPSGAVTVETACLEVSYSFLVSFFQNMRAALRKRVNWNITE
jgi:hypothetical protein